MRKSERGGVAKRGGCEGRAEAAACRGTTGRRENACREEDEEELQLAAQWGRKLREGDEGMQKSLVVSFFSFNPHRNPDVTRELMKGEERKQAEEKR